MSNSTERSTKKLASVRMWNERQYSEVSVLREFFCLFFALYQMAVGSLVSENFCTTFMTPKKLVHFVSRPLPTRFAFWS